MKTGQLLNAPEETLAIGVLSQAAHDLRKFHNATEGLPRELYLDAYRWITDDDFNWPYSFLNMCELLDVPPETFREELLADASLGWFGYWTRMGARFGRTFRASLFRAFKSSRNSDTPEPGGAIYFVRHS